MATISHLLRRRTISSALLLPLLEARVVERNHHFYCSSSSTKKERASDSNPCIVSAIIYYPKNSSGFLSRKPLVRPFTSTEELDFDTFSSGEKENDDNILRVIELDIKSMDEIIRSPDNFLVKVQNGLPFKAEYDSEKQSISLVREYRNEINQVKFYFDESLLQGDGNDERIWFPLDVSISKKIKNGTSMKFGCSTRFDGSITINSISLKNSDSNEDEGWVLEDWALDESFRKHFGSYLEIRGINPTLTVFLFRYIGVKHRVFREYFMCLKKFKQFLED